MPVVTTLHTVLREPNIDQRTVMAEIATLSDRTHCHEPAIRRYSGRSVHVSPDKNDLIPTGSPICRFTDPVSSRMAFEPKEKMCCSRSACLAKQGIEKT